MTNTSTARDAIRDAADSNGWTRADYGRIGEDYTRGSTHMRVIYNRLGRVTEAERHEGKAFEVTGYVRLDSGKRETVIAWLEEPTPVRRGELGAAEPAGQSAREALDLLAIRATGSAAGSPETRALEDVILNRLGELEAQLQRATGLAVRDANRVRELERALNVANKACIIARVGSADAEEDAEESAAIVEGLVRVIGQLEGEVRASAGVIDRQHARFTRQNETLQAAADAIGLTPGALLDGVPAAITARITELESRVAHLQRVAEFGDDTAAQARVLVQLISQEGRSTARTMRAATRLGQRTGAARDRGYRADLVLQDEVLPELAGEMLPTTAREALRIDGRPAVRPQLPGESTTVQELVLNEDGVSRGHRIYGTLVRPTAQVLPEFLRTSTLRDARAVPLELVLPYLAAVRGYGFPGPARRRELLEAVAAAHGVELVP